MSPARRGCAALLLLAGVAAACGGSGSEGGMGMEMGMGGGPGNTECSDAIDCTKCTDDASCVTCWEKSIPDGYQDAEALLECVLCSACYTVNGTMGCPDGPPKTLDPCDTGTLSECSACAQAATGSCAAAAQTCQKSFDCMTFEASIQACPSM